MSNSAPVFRILALAPFSPDQTAVWETPPHPIDRYTLDEAIEQVAADLYIALEPALCPDGGIKLRFNNLKSFHPDGIAKSNPYLSQLIQAQTFIRDANASGLSASEIRQGLHQYPDLPTIRIDEKPPKARSSAKSGLDNILDMVSISDNEPVQPPRQKDAAAQLEGMRQSILDAIFGNALFQKMERAWRGARLLLQQGLAPETNAQVSIAALHPETLAENLAALTPYLIENLPNVILLDIPFDNSPLAAERLNAVAQWATTLMVPVVAWIPADFFKIPSWNDMRTLSYLPNHMDTSEFAKFRNLQAAEEGHWLCLMCNRFLTRFPYGPDNQPRHAQFSETHLPWISPVWALGALVAQSVANTGWPTRMTDIRHFRIEDLALQPLTSDSPIVTETIFDRDRMDQLIRAGITPVAAEAGRDIAFLPKAVAIAGTSLSFQLLLSQTTQFILWCKDHLPRETNPAELKQQLEDALHRFSTRSTPPGFEKIEVTTQVADAQGRIPLHLSLTPSSRVIPQQQPIQLQIDW